jgi:hypothetical protein
MRQASFFLRNTKMMAFIVLIASIACNDGDPTPKPNPSDNEPPDSFAVDVGESSVPYVVIQTDGLQILNEPKVSAHMYIYQNKSLIQSQTIGIEYRGSTSFRISDKKSFGIETWDASGDDVDISFFGFPEEEDWILLGHVVNLTDHYIFDRTLMYNYLGYNWSRSIGRYASRTQFVELEINGDYQGLYVFLEKLKRDGDRIAVSKNETTDEDQTGGYILKIDKTSGGDQTLGQPLEYYYTNWDDDARYTESNSFRSHFDFNGDSISFLPYGSPYHPNQYLETYFLYEYPKAEEISQSQKEYIIDYIYQFEKALLTDDFSALDRSYTAFIDVDTFVDYLLLSELTRNIDAYRLSTYLYKDKAGKLSMGPIWDLNIGFDSGDRIPWDGWVYEYNQYVMSDAWMVHFWWPRLMSDPVFRQQVKTRWQTLRNGPLSTEILLQSISQTKDYLDDNGVVERNYVKWDQGINVDHEASVQSLKDFVEFRVSWMDEQIGAF